MAVFPPSDWRDIFAEDSQIPFDNTQDALEAMRGELERTGPPEDTQPHLFEGQDAPEQGAQLLDNKPEEREEPQERVEPDNKPEVREKELQRKCSPEPEDETDDEDAKRQELVPEDNKCQEEKPEELQRKCSPEPEDETDDEDAKRQELVPEDNKCQEEKPEAYVVHSSPGSGTTEPAPDAEEQCKSHYERAHSQWLLEGRSSLP